MEVIEKTKEEAGIGKALLPYFRLENTISI